MKTNKCKSASHCRYLLRYHIVICPKFRYSVLTGDVSRSLEDIFAGICREYHYDIIAVKVMPDHVHLFVSAPQTAAPCDIVRTLKSVSAVQMFRQYPSLKRFYARCGSLWSDGYYIGTIGDACAETVEKYIRNQSAENYIKTKDWP